MRLGCGGSLSRAAPTPKRRCAKGWCWVSRADRGCLLTSVSMAWQRPRQPAVQSLFSAAVQSNTLCCNASCAGGRACGVRPRQPPVQRLHVPPRVLHGWAHRIRQPQLAGHGGADLGQDDGHRAGEGLEDYKGLHWVCSHLIAMTAEAAAPLPAFLPTHRSCDALLHGCGGPMPGNPGDPHP